MQVEHPIRAYMFNMRTLITLEIEELVWGSLVGQWVRICQPMQETQVRSQVFEYAVCHRASKPMNHNY